jgi:hypothetical protein
MFKSATGKSVDGTISIDPYAISELLKITGPIDVAGYGKFSADDFFPKINYIVNVSKEPGSGKEALPKIAQLILQQVLGQPISSWPALLTTMQEQVRTRHLQFSLHDQQIAGLLSENHANGALVTAHSDYLMVVDGNVSGNKADYYIRKSMQLKVEADANGLVRHEAILEYAMPPPVDDVDRALNPGDGRYKDYLRFYLPETATPATLRTSLDGGRVDSVMELLPMAHGKRVVGVYIEVPRGHRLEVRLAYEVAQHPGRSYDLYIQKQAGVPGLPTSLSVSYPGGEVHRQLAMAADEEVKVRW